MKHLLTVAAVALSSAACSAMPELPEMIHGDWDPPVLTATEARRSDRVALLFNEPVELIDAAVSPYGTLVESRWVDDALELDFTADLAPGAEYWVDATVEDEAGNVSSVLVSVYGLNLSPPELRISEFVCEASGKHTDWVELEVLAGGNMGGVTLYEGSPGTWDSRHVFEPFEVATGDYLIVHFKPEVIPEEINETEDRTASGGNNAHPEAWDAWVDGGDGIPNTTGAVTLTLHPGGEILDAVLYTTKRYDAAHERRGFGRQSDIDMFEELQGAGAWEIAGDFIVPEDALDPEDSTATRSINRTPGAPDTNSAADWHIGPTSSASPGATNTTERYEP